MPNNAMRVWREACADAVAQRDARIEALTARLAAADRLAAALRFYADSDHYQRESSDGLSPVEADFGGKARAALAKWEQAND